MANEFERINNPDSTPGAISTGYQLQNTNLVAQRVGLDCSVVLGGTGQCTLEVSGPVDVNGEIYTCNAQVVFTLTTAGKYYIHLAGSGANLTPTIGTGANTFDADKNARYTDTGTYRVLNWVIYYDGTTAYAERWLNIDKDENLFEMHIDNAKITTAILTNSLDPKKQFNNFLHGTYTSNQVFDALSPYIPDVNDKIKISGGTVSQRSLSYAEKTAVNQITLYYFNNTSDIVGSTIVQDGGAGSFVLSMSW